MFVLGPRLRSHPWHSRISRKARGRHRPRPAKHWHGYPPFSRSVRQLAVMFSTRTQDPSDQHQSIVVGCFGGKTRRWFGYLIDRGTDLMFQRQRRIGLGELISCCITIHTCTKVTGRSGGSVHVKAKNHEC
ncbi:uncharacterized protein BJ212DRAFT_441012 [Suillus subaureus]|uniref:Uncharacterized protein n=1 Tax=Suillus subaureus TaxID=48587 RepID=A0A9P7E6X7_9AGAM|nr:uncharacterized protein BJ212DRAFT_441012 [Suillus subaureus]KAG1812939.1 hypothetical protein BJ212DRAFT_441012 [Suillus subaureus]